MKRVNLARATKSRFLRGNASHVPRVSSREVLFARTREVRSLYCPRLMRFMNCVIDIARCPLTLILTKTDIILSNTKSYENDKKGLFYMKYPNSGLGAFLDISAMSPKRHVDLALKAEDACSNKTDLSSNNLCYYSAP